MWSPDQGGHAPHGSRTLVPGRADYRAAIDRLADALRDETQRYMDTYPDLVPEERTAHILERIVRPAVARARQQAVLTGAAPLPEGAEMDILSRFRGYGQMDRLLAMAADGVTEIMVNGPERPVIVEQDGRLVETDVVFRDRTEIVLCVERMANGAAPRLSPGNPVVELRLPGARIIAMDDSVCIGGPSITVRLQHVTPLRGPDLVAHGMLAPGVWDFLVACFTGGANIVIAGGTGSGKTTLAQALLAALPRERRIIAIQDPIEFSLADRPNYLALEVRQPDLPAEQHVIHALRQRPDHLVIGEVRDAAAWPMIDAMGLGHDGSLTTVHASDPEGVLIRLENLCGRVPGHLTGDVIRGAMASALNLLVVVRRVRARGETGDVVRRVVTHVAEVQGYDGARFTLAHLFTWRGGQLERGSDSLSRGLRLRIEDNGVALPPLETLGQPAPSAPGFGYREP